MGERKSSAEQITVLGQRFAALTKEELLQAVAKKLRGNGQTAIFTPNPQMLLRSARDKHVAHTLRRADILLPDGIGVVLASRLLGTPLPCRISGIDFAHDILDLAAKEGLHVFLLGGRPGVAAAAAKRLKSDCSGLKICGCAHGYFDERQSRELLKKIRLAEPKIIFVCLGSPRQEEWIAQNMASIPSLGLAMGLGGSLDVWSGKLKRAPKALQKAGLEWLWRVLREPRRIGIFLDIPCFLLRVLLTDKIQKRC